MTEKSEKEDGRYIVNLSCDHCNARRAYSYPVGTRLWHPFFHFRASTLMRTKCGVCGVVGELDR